MELTVDNIIWSKGPLRNEYANKHTEESSSQEEILNRIRSVTETNNIIFIRNGSSVHDLQHFVTHLDSIPFPILLITSDGDRSMPQSHDRSLVMKILFSPMILKWYTQNYDKSVIHPKLTYMPIGFDLHTPRWLIHNSMSEKVKFMMSSRFQSSTRIANVILCDAHNISHPERSHIYQLHKNNKRVYFSKPLPFSEMTIVYNQYQFALSPRGNGLDCHRTWELFLAGVIVITKTSPLDEMYKKHNLPVVILQDWNELSDNMDTKLKAWYYEHINKTFVENIFKKLTFEYWLTHE